MDKNNRMVIKKVAFPIIKFIEVDVSHLKTANKEDAKNEAYDIIDKESIENFMVGDSWLYEIAICNGSVDSPDEYANDKYEIEFLEE